MTGLDFPRARNLATLAVAVACLLATPTVSADIVSAMLPASRSVQVGDTATAFATIINAGSTTANSCSIVPSTVIPASFTYQTTDPTSNALTGTPNTPATIPAGGSQSYVVAFTPNSVISPTDVQFNFDCADTNPAPVFSGLNTLLLSASTTPVPDIIALAATSPNDLIVRLNDAGAFAVATVNVGATDTITATADTGGANIPIAMSICETDPASGACLAAPASAATGVTTTIVSDATPTFSIFATATQDIPLDPAGSRIFVRFRDGGGAVRGATSVAVQGTANVPNPACTVRTPIGINQTLNGTLSTTDCTVRELVGDPDDTYVDVYEVTLASSGTLTITMQSNTLDSFLILADTALTATIEVADDGFAGEDEQISISLTAGTYAILANSYEVETGSYSLTTSFGGTPTNVLGSYSGQVDETLANCDDSEDNGQYQFPTTVNINSQTGSNYSGTLMGQTTISGFSVRLEGTIAGTVNTTGNITGNLNTELFVNNAFDSASQASGSGSLVGNTLTFNFSGADTVGDTCTFTGTFVGTR